MVDCVSINVCNKLASWNEVPLAYEINLSNFRPTRFLHLYKIIGRKLTFIVEAQRMQMKIFSCVIWHPNKISFMKWNKINIYANSVH